ncbi:unnamed protein product [Prunus armeniaca]
MEGTPIWGQRIRSHTSQWAWMYYAPRPKELLDLYESFIIGCYEIMWDARGDVDFFG